MDGSPEFNPQELPPEERVRLPQAKLDEAGFTQRIVNDALVIAKGGNDIPPDEIDKIVGFVRPIDDGDLSGQCTQRTAESVFAGEAQYGWLRPPFTENTGVIPMGLHMVAGKQLENGAYAAFDTVSRAVILRRSTGNREPLAQTIIFYGNSEGEIQESLKRFYGGDFRKEKIQDTPYDRAVSQRNQGRTNKT